MNKELIEDKIKDLNKKENLKNENIIIENIERKENDAKRNDENDKIIIDKKSNCQMKKELFLLNLDYKFIIYMKVS